MTSSPIGLHHFPLGASTEMMQHRMGDFYMLGHAFSWAPGESVIQCRYSSKHAMKQL